MKILDIEQQTQEWYTAKAGLPSSSNFDKIVTTKGDFSKQAQQYMYRLAGERITGERESTFQSAAMKRGCILEEEARVLYEMLTGETVNQVGLCIADEGFVTSPDGLVGDDGLLEVKCPLMATHVEYLLKGKLPMTYFQQVQGQLLVTGRKWCDFMSYYPAMKPLIVRVERDEDFINTLKDTLIGFCKELDIMVEKIK